MRLKSLLAMVMALFFASALQAQADQVPITPPAAEPENILHLDLSTGGRVSIQLRPDAAPNHVERIRTLTRQGFYDGIIFHRVIDGFMAQTGDPTGTGEGSSPLPDLEPEFNRLPHVRGAVSMARASAENSANSQFFIMFAPRLGLDNKYTVFGRVISGMGYVDAIERGEPPANPSRILRASIGADNIAPGAAMPPAAGAPRAAAAAAAEAAVDQSLDAATSANVAAQAAEEGDTAEAADQARAAAIAAEGAAQAAEDAAEAADQAETTPQ